jgi:hypothetical protein
MSSRRIEYLPRPPQNAMDHMGFVLEPGRSINQALSRTSLGGSDPDGCVIQLTPGIHQYEGGAGLTIARKRVRIQGAGWRQTTLRNVTGGSGALIRVEGEEVVISDLAIDDASTSQPSIVVVADRVTIERVWFKDCFMAINVDGADWVRVMDNHIVASRVSSYAIFFDNTCDSIRCSGNTIEQTGQTTSIYAGDSVSNFTATGNVCATISYKSTGANNTDAGNAAAVTARP